MKKKSDNSIGSRPRTSLLLPNASENAASFIKSMIYSGELGSGDRLPSERVLAPHLGISTLTLRIALNSLVVSGFVVTSRGSRGGSRVCDIPSLLKCWSDWMALHADELDDIFEFRTIVETRIAYLAAERRTSDELLRIEQANDFIGDTRSSLFRWDVEFHDALARASHNRRLERAMIAVRGEIFLPVDQALHEGRIDEVRKFHKAIVSAVRDKDGDAAAEHMKNQIEDTRRMIGRAARAARASTPSRAVKVER